MKNNKRINIVATIDIEEMWGKTPDELKAALIEEEFPQVKYAALQNYVYFWYDRKKRRAFTCIQDTISRKQGRFLSAPLDAWDEMQEMIKEYMQRPGLYRLIITSPDDLDTVHHACNQLGLEVTILKEENRR